jgi:DNA-binding transcriptional ArsR family regulator
MHITLTSEDLTKIRFEASPMWETVTSLRTLQVGTPIHRPWIESAKRGIAASTDPRKAAHLRLLTTVVRPTGFMADGLTPTPRHQDSFEEMLELSADIEGGIARIVEALRWYWGTAVEPWWPRLRAVLLADIDSRLAEIARNGIVEVFRSLHPSVLPTPTGLEIVRGCDQVVPPEPGQGLILIPNAFIWPNTRVLNARPFVPTITYAPRGVGRLWESTREAAASPVAQLLGRTRAQILAQLDVPMTTTQLACALDLAAGTVNGHLKVMAAGGLASSLRAGREVFYRRAEVGEALIARV